MKETILGGIQGVSPCGIYRARKERLLQESSTTKSHTGPPVIPINLLVGVLTRWCWVVRHTDKPLQGNISSQASGSRWWLGNSSSGVQLVLECPDQPGPNDVHIWKKAPILWYCINSFINKAKKLLTNIKRIKSIDKIGLAAKRK